MIAALAATGSFPQLASRLWDVGPDGRQLLVARGALRPRASAGPEPFQLSPAGWHVAPGHVVKLELLGQDAPHLRPSNGAFSITVRDLELRLPVAERPDGAQILAPAAAVLPAGASAAADLAPPPAPRVQRLRVRVTYPAGRRGCGARVARLTLQGAATRSVRAVLVRRGRRVVARDTRFPFTVRVRRVARARRAHVAGLELRVTFEGGSTRRLRAVARFCAR